MTETILYQRTQFAYPMSLVSPPILLQTRVEKTHVCRNHLGSVYQDKIWADTTNGGERGKARARSIQGDTEGETLSKRERDCIMDCAGLCNFFFLQMSCSTALMSNTHYTM